jgi:hypothetical protein
LKVYLLTTGDGSDGNEWQCLGIYTTPGLAEQAQQLYQRPRHRRDGSTYTFEASIEEWDVDQPLVERTP